MQNLVSIQSLRICSIENGVTVHTVVEDLCVEDTNVLGSCDLFLSDYKRFNLFE